MEVFLKNNGLHADHTLDIEVYPHERICVGCENGPEWAFTIKDIYITPPKTKYPEMYSLFSVKER